MDQEMRENPGVYYESNHQYYGPAPSQNTSSHSQSYLADMEQRINKESTAEAKAYITAQDLPHSDNMEQVFLVYKFVNTPHDVLVAGLR